MGFSSGGGGTSLPEASPALVAFDSGNIDPPSGAEVAFSHTAQVGWVQARDSAGGSLDTRLYGRNVWLQTNAGGIILECDAAGPLLINVPFKTAAAQEAAAATAGGGVALPATVAGFLIFQDHAGVVRKIPYYAN